MEVVGPAPDLDGLGHASPAYPRPATIFCWANYRRGRPSLIAQRPYRAVAPIEQPNLAAGRVERDGIAWRALQAARRHPNLSPPELRGACEAAPGLLHDFVRLGHRGHHGNSPGCPSFSGNGRCSPARWYRAR